VLLACVSILLARESAGLLTGERTNRARLKRLRQIITEDSAVERVGDLLTMQLGPDQVLLTVDIRFREGLQVRELESAIDRLESRIRDAEPSVVRIFLEADSLKREEKPRNSEAA
jgi:divalent metal cation (Fe/Co/Zn/Cd) transporter